MMIMAMIFKCIEQCLIFKFMRRNLMFEYLSSIYILFVSNYLL